MKEQDKSESLEDPIVPLGEDKMRPEGCLLLINALRYPHRHAGTISKSVTTFVAPAPFLNGQAGRVLCST